MREIREFIFNYYDEGTCLSLYDDIIDIKMKNPNENEKDCLVKLDNLKEIVDKGFENVLKIKLFYGEYIHVIIAGFMKNNITTHLAFCVGWMWGCIIDKECLKLNISQYEDYERSIKVFKKYGKVIRLNNICAKTKYNNNEGGMCDDNRINIMKRDLEILKELYSDYIMIKNKKSSILGVNPQIKSNIKKVL